MPMSTMSTMKLKKREWVIGENLDVQIHGIGRVEKQIQIEAIDIFKSTLFFQKVYQKI